MRTLGKWIGRILLALAVIGVVLWLVGPYEDATLEADFDASLLDGGVEAHFASVESAYDDIIPGVAKQVIWAGDPETKTDWAVVYIHGFSATSEEIRPVPDDVAAALGANLILTRLQGHGRGSEPLAEGTANGWMMDTSEALAAARAVGNRVLVLSTSTGGTLSAAAALDPEMSKDVAGMVMISPNFAINNPAAPLLTWPAGRYWLPLLMGDRRAWEPRNEQQRKYWTTEYPSVAGLPVAALVKKVVGLDQSQNDMPALFIFVDEDQVVRAEVTREVIAGWGGPAQVLNPMLSDDDDTSRHVIAGDILSKGQTAPTVEAIVTWAKGL